MHKAILLTVLFGSTLLVAGSFHDGCERSIVQSMPDGLKLVNPAGVVVTHESLIEMVTNAKSTLRIASFYWWLTAPPEFQSHSSVVPGKKLMSAISTAAARGVDVQVILDRSGRRDMSNPDDLVMLEKFATLKHLNMTKLIKSGVLHSKFMIVDNSTFYLGSSNFDWRSYTQIKEIGVTFKNCPLLAQDLDKVFRTYMLMADSDRVPDQLHDDLNALYNIKRPLVLDQEKLFMGASPPQFNGVNGSTERTNDIEGLLHTISRARHNIDISVMNYSPRVEFTFPHRFWMHIENALRDAAVNRRIRVRLLFSKWTGTKPLELLWYKSLNAIQSPELRGGGIHVKLFEVPAFDNFQRSIPFARVKHDKYMVTDGGLYIGTSNWTPDYFTNTCGVGLVVEPTTPGTAAESSQMIKTMQAIFERDFNSEYAHELE